MNKKSYNPKNPMNKKSYNPKNPILDFSYQNIQQWTNY